MIAPETSPQTGDYQRWCPVEPGASTLRVSWSQQPQAEERDYRGRWVACLPEERLIHPVLDEEAKRRLGQDARKRYDMLASFRASVPDQFALAVEGFRSHQWNLLVLMNAQSKARDLTRSNPVLSYALANNHEFRLKPDHTALPLARFHCRQKQREILKWLNFPESEILVRALKKIDPDAVTLHRLRLLRNVLKKHPSALKKISHLKRINPQVLDFFMSGVLIKLATPRLLEELSDPQNAGAGSLADRLMHALAFQRDMGVNVRSNPFNSIAKIDAFTERVDRDYMAYEERARLEEAQREVRREEQRQQAEARQEAAQRRAEEDRKQLARLNRKQWPRPPIAGTPCIRPIVSYAGLKQEAKQQNNCVAVYWRQVVMGELYVYSVRWPGERATLAIRCMQGSFWRVSELKRKGNRDVSTVLRGIVNQWLYEHELLKGSA